MFNAIYAPHNGVPQSGLGPMLVSWAVHAVMIGTAVAVPLLRVSGSLPEMPAMAAFVVPSAATPPPPPPPPAVRIAQRPAQASPEPTSGAMAAPIEAPSDVTPEPAFAEPAGGEDEGVPGGVPGGVAGGVAGGIVSAPPPPPPPPPAEVVPPRVQEPVRIGGDIRQPQLLKRVEPVYPPVARQAWVEGTVILEATVSASGAVTDVRVLRSIPLLDQAARDAVRQWVYRPLVLNGRASPFVLTVVLSFNISRG